METCTQIVKFRLNFHTKNKINQFSIGVQSNFLCFLPAHLIQTLTHQLSHTEIGSQILDGDRPYNVQKCRLKFCEMNKWRAENNHTCVHFPLRLLLFYVMFFCC